MDLVSQSCPSCKASKYNNPQLRLMVNVCGHSLCENCVEVLFVRGSGLCVQCKTPIRKVNFRYQLFEDPAVQKEVDIRKKILNEFNKREDNFDTMEEYDLYLEQIEEINKTRKMVEQYKKDNKELIKRNRIKLSSSNEFYEMELERERFQREKREKAEAEDSAAKIINRKRLLATKTLEGFLNGGVVNLPESLLTDPAMNVTSSKPPDITDATSMPPPSTMPTAVTVLESKHRFLPPPSGTASSQMRNVPASAFGLPPPPTSAMRWGGVVPPSGVAGGFITPVSGFIGLSPAGGGGCVGWGGAPEFYSTGQPRAAQEDIVVLRKPKQPKLSHKLAENNTSAVSLLPGAFQQRTLKQWLAPFEVELCGPQPPSAEKDPLRWPDLESTYLHSVVEPLTASIDDNKDSGEVSITMEAGESAHSGVEEGGSETRRGISCSLPRGTCGIEPNVFLTRALQDSRCGLFI